MYDLYFSFAWPSIVTISITTARLQLEPFIIAMNSTGPQPPCLAAMPWWPDDDVDTFKPLILVYHWLEKVTINPYEVFREETLITLVLSGQFLTHRTFKTWQHGISVLIFTVATSSLHKINIIYGQGYGSNLNTSSPKSITGFPCDFSSMFFKAVIVCSKR